MAKIEAVILDWAGTTVDFGCFAPVQAFIDAFESEGITPTAEEVRKPMGMLKRDHVRTMMSMERIRRLWLEKHGKDWDETDVNRVYEKSEKSILGIVQNFAEPKPYVLETVNALRESGIKIGSTTGYTDDMMEVVVPKAAALGYAPDAWFSPNAVENQGRPSPYMIFRNMEALHVGAVQNVIKVGDTVSDIKEGKNAGVISVGVIEGSSVMGLSEEEFAALTREAYQEKYQEAERTYREAGADYVIAHLGQLPEVIRDLEK